MSVINVYVAGYANAWGAYLKSGDEVRTLSQHNSKLSTYNNLSAAIQALEKCRRAERVNLYVSPFLYQYVKNHKDWIKRKWKTKANTDLVNKALWIELHDLVSSLPINWVLSSLDSDEIGMIRAVELANEEIKRYA